MPLSERKEKNPCLNSSMEKFDIDSHTYDEEKEFSSKSYIKK